MRGRIMDPYVGRFMTPDPFVFHPFDTAGLNRYSYVQNDPVNFTDPSGFDLNQENYRPCEEPASFWDIFKPVSQLRDPSAVSFTGPQGNFAPLGGDGGGSPGAPGYGAGNAGTTSVNSSAQGDSSQLQVRASELGVPAQFDPRNSPSRQVQLPEHPPNPEDFDLRFDGSELTWYAPESADPATGARPILEQWKAYSGRPGYNAPQYQSRKRVGPIPEGFYRVRRRDLQRYADTRVADRVKGTIGLGSWPGGTRAWGAWRVWLEPIEGTATLGRDGFSIHGGADFGSAGCIDLSIGIDSFARMFMDQGRDLILQVKY